MNNTGISTATATCCVEALKRARFDREGASDPARIKIPLQFSVNQN